MQAQSQFAGAGTGAGADAGAGAGAGMSGESSFICLNARVLLSTAFVQDILCFIHLSHGDLPSHIL